MPGEAENGDEIVPDDLIPSASLRFALAGQPTAV
jgi:hypothetical protein